MEPSIKYVAIFWTNFYPLPCHTLSHISGPPKVRNTSRTPPILVVQKSRTKPPVQNLSQWFAGFLFRGFVQDFLCGRFCPGCFLSVPPSVRILLLQQKVKHHFQFHVSCRL